MRWITFLALTLTTLRAGTLDDARITMSYQELQQLIAASKKDPAPPPPPPKPPVPSTVPSTVLSAVYDLAIADDHLAGSATFQIQTFGPGPHLVPLFGQHAKIEAIDPPTAILVPDGGNYALLLDGPIRVKATFRVLIPTEETDAPWQNHLAIPAATFNTLTLSGLDPEHLVHIENAIARTTSPTQATYELGAIDFLRISRQPKPRVVAPPPVVVAVDLPVAHVETPAIIHTVTSEMKIVRDGASITASTWTIRHDSALNWTLVLPDGSQLLSCRIAGQPAAPLQQDARTLIFPLPAPKDRDDTTVELTYTGRQAAFDPVRGEFDVELPATPLLVESLAWSLRIPRPYETVAIQGNVDFQPAREDGEIRLTRELGRGDAPTAHIFYQKPETTK